MKKIDKNIPFEESMVLSKRKYPIIEMEVGDSFAFTKEEKGGVHSSINWVMKKNPDSQKLWKIAKDPLDSSGFRAWRVR